MSDTIEQQLAVLDAKTTKVAKMKAQHIITRAQQKIDFTMPYDGSEVLVMLEAIKDQIEEIES